MSDLDPRERIYRWAERRGKASRNLKISESRPTVDADDDDDDADAEDREVDGRERSRSGVVVGVAG